MSVTLTGGAQRGRMLAVPDGVRPAMGKVRSALFDSVRAAQWGALEGAMVLDLACGGGTLACEALSRGASRAALVDCASAALATARDNLARLGFTNRAQVFCIDSRTMTMAAAERPASLVFIDLPYDRQGAREGLLDAAQRAGWLVPQSVLCVLLPHKKASAHTFPPETWVTRIDRRYGVTRLWIGHRTV
ncbi:MAG: RsmD family RNA methyltransferase [Pseudomonadota bacterium]